MHTNTDRPTISALCIINLVILQLSFGLLELMHNCLPSKVALKGKEIDSSLGRQYKVDF